MFVRLLKIFVGKTRGNISISYIRSFILFFAEQTASNTEKFYLVHANTGLLSLFNDFWVGCSMSCRKKNPERLGKPLTRIFINGRIVSDPDSHLQIMDDYIKKDNCQVHLHCTVYIKFYLLVFNAFKWMPVRRICPTHS